LGDEQAVGAAPSSEQVVLLTVPVVVQVNDAVVEVVDEAGPPVNPTLGADGAGVPPPPLVESS
jgi:hypothetical protein